MYNSEGDGSFLDWNSKGMGEGGDSYMYVVWDSKGMGGFQL